MGTGAAVSAWHEGLPAFTIAVGQVVRCENTGDAQPGTGHRASAWIPRGSRRVEAVLYMPKGAMGPAVAHAVNRALASSAAPS